MYNGKEGDYTIKAGDNLSKIAKQYGVSVKDLTTWNNIKDPNKIRSGAKLRTSNGAPAAVQVVNSGPTSPDESPGVPTIDKTQAGNAKGSTNTSGEVNEGDAYKTGANEVSVIPKATDRMVEAGIEYDWNVEGRVQGFLEGEQKAQEAKRSAIEEKSKINYDKAINEAGMAQISSAQNKNKMGITGMSADAMDRAVQVTKNVRALEIYSQDEMVKYGYDAGVKFAAMYGDLKGRQVTIEEYKKAVDESYNRSIVTGYYFDPIQMQLISQRGAAEMVINSTQTTAADKERATKVKNGVREGLLELGLTDKGAQTLDAFHKLEGLKLAADANAIAAGQLGLTSAMNRDTIMKSFAQSFDNIMEITPGLLKTVTEDLAMAEDKAGFKFGYTPDDYMRAIYRRLGMTYHTPDEIKAHNKKVAQKKVENVVQTINNFGNAGKKVLSSFGLGKKK